MNVHSRLLECTFGLVHSPGDFLIGTNVTLETLVIIPSLPRAFPVMEMDGIFDHAQLHLGLAIEVQGVCAWGYCSQFPHNLFLLRAFPESI